MQTTNYKNASTHVSFTFQTQDQTNGIYRAQPVRIVGEAQELQKILLDQKKQMEEEKVDNHKNQTLHSCWDYLE